MTDHQEPSETSPTSELLHELQLYGFRPHDDEPDPRPLPESRLVTGALADIFDALVVTLQDTRLEPDLEDLLWSQVNLALGAVFNERARSPLLRIAVSTIFAAPAALAGYHLACRLAGVGTAAEWWRVLIAFIGAVVIGSAAWVRLNAPARLFPRVRRSHGIMVQRRWRRARTAASDIPLAKRSDEAWCEIAIVAASGMSASPCSGLLPAPIPSVRA